VERSRLRWKSAGPRLEYPGRPQKAPRLGAARRAKFAVAFLFTGDQTKQRHNLQDSLRAITDAEICFEIPPQQIGWRDSKISEMSAITWQLSEERLPA
jgi:hypothetical protein